MKFFLTFLLLGRHHSLHFRVHLFILHLRHPSTLLGYHIHSLFNLVNLIDSLVQHFKVALKQSLTFTITACVILKVFLITTI